MKLWKIYENDIPLHILEVASTPTMQRLKHIGMSCGCEYTSFARFQKCPTYTRYDHSLGVALIIWHFTRDIKQSIAGLLHDVATPVFAHVVDFLHNDYLKQEYTESNTESIILSDKQLVSILTKYNLSVNDVKDYHKYPIADNDAPKLSADRLEYTLGNLVHYGLRTKDIVVRYYNNIIVKRNEYGTPELMFKDMDIAESFSRDSLLCSKVYTSDEDRYSMQVLANILRNAMRDHVINEIDLYTTEKFVIQKLQLNNKYNKKWKIYCSYSKVITSPIQQFDKEWIYVNAKKRYINPSVVGKGRVSNISSIFENELLSYQQEEFNYWICGICDS